jgi:hypothetical protein
VTGDQCGIDLRPGRIPRRAPASDGQHKAGLTADKEISVSLLTSFRGSGRRRRALAAGATALGVAALTVGLTVAPASASTYEATLSIRSLGGNGSWHLDSNGQGVYGGGRQSWDFFENGYPTASVPWNFRVTGTGNCLDGNSAGAVYALPCNSNNAYQNWTLGAGNDLGFTLQSVGTGLCLNIDPGNGAVNAIACNWNNLNEVWAWDSPS